MDLQYYLEKGTKLFETYAPDVAYALVVLVIGLWVAGVIRNRVVKGLEKSSVDKTLQTFLGSFLGILLKLLVVLSVIRMVGINVISFVAVLSAATFAIGLALQGSLSNFAGGVMILMFKPFKVGDFIDAAGYMGTVNEIQIFNTILKTPDNKTVIIPNSVLSGNSLVNFSTEATRRVDMSFGIGYDDDIKAAKELLAKIIKEDDRILKEPEPAILVAELADSSVNFAVRVWCNSSDYWGIFFDMQEKVKLEFDKADINIPYPQQDVHIINK